MTNRELLIRAGRACRETTRKPLRRLGLAPAQDDLLLAVAALREPMNLAALARQLSMSGPTMTKSIKRLAARKLVELGKVEGDGRMRTVWITDKGKDLTERVRGIHDDVEAMIRAGSVLAKGTLADKLELICVALEPAPKKLPRKARIAGISAAFA